MKNLSENLPGTIHFQASIKAGDIQSARAFVKDYKTQKEGYWWNNEEIKVGIREAILTGQTDMVQYFLEQELDPNAYVPTHSGLEPLIVIAARAGKLAITKLLVEAGAIITEDEDSLINSRRSIEEAILANHTNVALYLLEQGAPAKHIIGFTKGKSLLAVAAAHRNIRLVEALLAKGADIVNTLGLAYDNYHQESVAIKLRQQHYSKERVNQEAQDLEAKRQNLRNDYQQMVTLLLDYAIGIDFPNLNFLHSLNLAGINFIGVSCEAEPVTQVMLEKPGTINADKAITTLAHLEAHGIETLKNRVKEKIDQLGYLERDNHLNLVPLAYAAAIGDEDAVRTRLNAGIHPNAPAKDYLNINTLLTPLLAATQKGHLAVVKCLAEHEAMDNDILVLARTEAKKHNQFHIATYLESLQDVNSRDKEGNTLLIRQDQEAIKTLLERGADITLVNHKQESPLILAAQQAKSEEYLELLALLLKQQPDDKSFMAALTIAVKKGYSQAADLILSAMPDKPEVEVTKFERRKQTTLAMPWYYGLVFMALNSPNAIELLSILKKHGAEFNTQDVNNGKTVLLEAISHYGLDELKPMLHFLVMQGANPTLANHKGRSPLHALVEKYDYYTPCLAKDYWEMISWLLDKGANIDAQDKDGNTPLHVAALNKTSALLIYLVLRGAAINRQDNYGRTPLHEAAVHCNLEATKALLHLGTDTMLVEEAQLTPLMLLNRLYDVQKKEAPRERRKFAEFEAPFKAIQQAFAQSEAVKAERKKLQTMLITLTKPLIAFISSYAAELIRQATTNSLLSREQLVERVEDILAPVADNSVKQSLIQALLGINQIASVNKTQAMGINNTEWLDLVYHIAIKALAKNYQEYKSSSTLSNFSSLLTRTGSPLHTTNNTPSDNNKNDFDSAEDMDIGYS